MEGGLRRTSSYTGGWVEEDTGYGLRRTNFYIGVWVEEDKQLHCRVG